MSGSPMMKTASIQKKIPINEDTAQRITRRVTYQEAFRFYTGIGYYTGQAATSLEDFAETLKTVDTRAIDFHMERRDFEKWVTGVFGDEELAQRINQRASLRGEDLRKELGAVVKNRLEKLRKM
jgi:hypothetical protein